MIRSKKLKIAVALSGGVDSAVAAKLLTEQGHEIIGLFINFWRESASTKENKCCSNNALKDARLVAQKIGFPLYVMNFSSKFKKIVVEDFLESYDRGETPNPCVICNKKIKLGLLIKKAQELGYNFVATGHYARLESNIESPRKNQQNMIYRLYRAEDKLKDQSYFLYSLNQSELKHLIFPLADLEKKQVRQLAKKFNLPVAQKKESQEICFIPEKSHNDFLKRHLKLRPGIIKNTKGETVGQHQGLPLYTIGQRKGVEIGGKGPFYVVEKKLQKNILLVTDKKNDNRLYKTKFSVKNFNWMSDQKTKFPFACEVVIRYRHPPVKCKIVDCCENKLTITLNEPQRAVTKGQSAVFYLKDQVLGGGIIA